MHGTAVRRHHDLRAPVESRQLVQTGLSVEAPMATRHESADLIERRAILWASRKDDANAFPLESVRQRRKRPGVPELRRPPGHGIHRDHPILFSHTARTQQGCRLGFMLRRYGDLIAKG